MWSSRGHVQAGDDITIVGMLRKRWRPLVRGVRCDAEMAIEALSVKVNNEDRGAAHVARETKIEFDQFWSAFDTDSARLRGRDQLIAAACPDLASMFLVKLAMVPAPPSDSHDLTIATASIRCATGAHAARRRLPRGRHGDARARREPHAPRRRRGHRQIAGDSSKMHRFDHARFADPHTALARRVQCPCRARCYAARRGSARVRCSRRG